MTTRVPYATDACTAANIHLVTRRTIRATPAFLFDAWTTPEQLRAWWGPSGVRCTHAEVDSRVGGRYRIANTFPDGKVVWIAGEFEVVEPPRKLVYSWRIERDATPSPDAAAERVTVRFDPCPEGTEVVVIHERIAGLAVRDAHEQGWLGCLGGLAAFAEKS
jgi:uncharacterized protein YndB with AHSA1/START domain